MGMAGRWHVGKATDILQDNSLMKRYVDFEHQGEEGYVSALPELIKLTTDEDRTSADAWCARDLPSFYAARERLGQLFPRFQLHCKLYERLVAQQPKPLLEHAMHLRSIGAGSTPESVRLEAKLRMPLSKFVALEDELAQDVAELKSARDELCLAYGEFARQQAHSQPSFDPSMIPIALEGLRKAADWYDHKRGFDFCDYAKWWIRAAIAKRQAPECGGKLQIEPAGNDPEQGVDK
jgi:hypothetical protein